MKNNSTHFGIPDLFRFLVGNKEAIWKAASQHPLSLLVPCIIFIASAGLARNYDHHPLSDPKWIIGPFGMALLTSTILYFSIRILTRMDSKRLNYATWLSLFCLSAPCAWLYAIPIEKTGDLILATKFNIAVLGLVSIWRVFLMVRILSTLTTAPLILCILAVLTPAAIEMTIAMMVSSMSIVGIMGGMLMSPENELVYKATSLIGGTSFFTAIIAIILYITFAITKRKERYASIGKQDEDSQFVLTQSTFALALSVFLFFFSLSHFHRERFKNQYTAQKLLAANNFSGAAKFFQGKSTQDFPRGYPIATNFWSYSCRKRIEYLTEVPVKSPAWIAKIFYRDIQNYRKQYQTSERSSYVYQNEKMKEIDLDFLKLKVEKIISSDSLHAK